MRNVLSTVREVFFLLTFSPFLTDENEKCPPRMSVYFTRSNKLLSDDRRDVIADSTLFFREGHMITNHAPSFAYRLLQPVVVSSVVVLARQAV